jgi:hypothetical protein
VGKGQRFDQIFVQTQSTGNAATDLGDFKGMRQAGAIIVTFMIDENLGFVFKAPERRTMDDAVTVPFIGGAIILVRLIISAAARRFALRSISG